MTSEDTLVDSSKKEVKVKDEDEFLKEEIRQIIYSYTIMLRAILKLTEIYKKKEKPLFKMIIDVTGDGFRVVSNSILAFAQGSKNSIEKIPEVSWMILDTVTKVSRKITGQSAELEESLENAYSLIDKTEIELNHKNFEVGETVDGDLRQILVNEKTQLEIDLLKSYSATIEDIKNLMQATETAVICCELRKSQTAECAEQLLNLKQETSLEIQKMQDRINEEQKHAPGRERILSQIDEKVIEEKNIYQNCLSNKILSSEGFIENEEKLNRCFLAVQGEEIKIENNSKIIAQKRIERERLYENLIELQEKLQISIKTLDL